MFRTSERGYLSLHTLHASDAIPPVPEVRERVALDGPDAGVVEHEVAQREAAAERAALQHLQTVEAQVEALQVVEAGERLGLDQAQPGLGVRSVRVARFKRSNGGSRKPYLQKESFRLMQLQ